jgi:hypothetical protein
VSVSNIVRTSPLLSKGFPRIHQFLWANAGIVPQVGYGNFLRRTFSIIRQLTYCHVWGLRVTYKTGFGLDD